MDFTIKQYTQLLKSLHDAGFFFKTFKEFSENPKEAKTIILRHDVDKLPSNSFSFAKLQAEMGICGTYYFRIVPQSYNESIIRQIADLGHEIGYHYETMDTCKGDVDKAYDEFCSNLEKFQKLAPVKTISMHGSPMSSFDNREIWKKYDYRQLGILAEPYFDINFNQLYYITDTGRRWDGDKFNVRDKPMKMSGERVSCERVSWEQVIDEIHRYHNIGDVGNETIRGNYLAGNSKDGFTNPEFLKLRFRHTSDIINAVNEGTFPNQAMLNFHPQRWNDAFVPWMKELVWQNVKNQGKRLLKAVRDER